MKDKYTDMSVAEILADMDAMVKVPWEVGVMSRGHGHNSYAVIAKDEDKSVIVECANRKDIAERIVNLHNGELVKDPSVLHAMVKNIGDSSIFNDDKEQSVRDFLNGVTSNSTIDEGMYFVMVGMFRQLFKEVDGG